MVILVCQSYRHAVLIFGLGLIGGSIFRALTSHRNWEVNFVDFGWVPGANQDLDVHSVENTLIQSLFSQDRSYPEFREWSVDIVWSAGRGGFGMDSVAAIEEFKSYMRVLGIAYRLTKQGAGTRFHLLSSAGGLFEGLRDVRPETMPRPQRIYGTLKHEQEKHLMNSGAVCCYSVYRPSSVFGYHQHGNRLGLIPTLIQNTLTFRVSHIFGSSITLRDFIYVDDVARFIGSRILDPSWTNECYLLVSGCASTIYEAVRQVEIVVRRKPYVQFDISPINAAHTTFHSVCWPGMWKPLDLTTGIRSVFFKMFC